MDISVFIARILGPLFITVGLGIMFNRGYYVRVMEDFCKNYALLFFTSLFPLVFGMVVLMFHNMWVADWRVIITIYGWGGLIKGIWLLLFPNTVHGFMQIYIKHKAFLIAHSIIAIMLGAILITFGYFIV